MPQRSVTTSSTQILLDYKQVDFGTDTTEDRSGAKTRSASKGNGRIRKALGVVAAFAGGAMAIEAAITTEPQPILPIAAQKPIAEPTSTELTPVNLTTQVQLPAKPDLQFVFKSSSMETPTGETSNVPFVQVDDFIDESNQDLSPATLLSGDMLDSVISAEPPDLLNEPSVLAVTVKKGDTLSGVLTDQGLSLPEIAQLTSLPVVSQHLVNIRPGQEIEITLGPDREISQISRVLDPTRTLLIERAESGERFHARLDEQPLDRELTATILTLDASLYADGKRAGLSDAIIMELYNIFQWTVDFNRQVQAGDTLYLLHETFLKNGEKIKDGKIMAAEFHSPRATHSAYRHTVGKRTSYYSETGQSLTQRFLRNPIKARITSKFNLQRKHPILHTIRAHRGVDYGAPQGTPVSAAGDGKIAFIGQRGGFGNTIVIQHGDRYSTLYAHLSKFTQGLKQGSRVSQGDTIGLVGKTGLATGAHLHYEFRVDNIHRDPQKVKLPGAPSLKSAELKQFQEAIAPLHRQLASMRDAPNSSDTLAMR